MIEQAVNVCQTTVVQDAWQRGQALSVHGWVYGLHDGRVRDLGLDMSNPAELPRSMPKRWPIWRTQRARDNHD